jgi:hypothetical protein
MATTGFLMDLPPSGINVRVRSPTTASLPGIAVQRIVVVLLVPC